ncbi:MAG: hypothetical protein OEW16_02655 [Gammaproteobacteria bacterium]|nr:hypothetical protein [Gammaproteobacteria bacterium]
MNQRPYRVISRPVAALIGVLLLAVASVVVWFAIQAMRATTIELGLLFEQSPEQAAAQVVQRVRIYALLYGGSLFALATWVAWTALRAIDTARMPPPGSWIIEGQRTHEGPAAVLRGRILLALAGSLMLLAAGLFIVLWRLAAEVVLSPQ